MGKVAAMLVRVLSGGTRLISALTPPCSPPQANQNVAKVAAVLVRVLGGGTRLISGEVGKRAVALLLQLQAAGVPAETLQVCVWGSVNRGWLCCCNCRPQGCLQRLCRCVCVVVVVEFGVNEVVWMVLPWGACSDTAGVG